MPDSRGEIEIRNYAVVGRFVQNGQSYGCEDSVVMGKNFLIWPIDAKKGVCESGAHLDRGPGEPPVNRRVYSGDVVLTRILNGAVERAPAARRLWDQPVTL